MNFRNFLMFFTFAFALPAFSNVLFFHQYCAMKIVCVTSKNKTLPDPYNLALEHVKEVIKDAKKRGLTAVNKSLNPRFLGDEQMRRELRGVHISFNSKMKLDITTSRKLIIELTEDLLDRITADKNLQAQSNPSPLTYKEINMDIAVLDDTSNFISDGTIANVFLLRGDIVYCKVNPQSHQLEKIAEEQYEKAKAI